MNLENLIPTHVLCLHYEIEISFIDELNEMGLIQLEWIEQNQFIHLDQISDLEKIIRLHNELNLNLEGIDIVFNLLANQRALQDELKVLTNKLRIYEQE